MDAEIVSDSAKLVSHKRVIAEREQTIEELRAENTRLEWLVRVHMRAAGYSESVIEHDLSNRADIPDVEAARAAQGVAP